MANALTPVEFHGATLSVILINDVPHVALKPICDAIGIDWQAQHARIKRHPVLGSVVSVTKTTGTDGKQYEMLMLPLDKLDGWLFGVSVRRVRPELRERLTRYQAECFDVLACHFGSAALRPDIAAEPVSVNRHALPAPARNRSPDHRGQPLPLPAVILEPARSLLDAAVWRLTGQAREQIADWAARRLAHSCRVDVAEGLQRRAEGVIDALTLDDFLTCGEASRARVLLSLSETMVFAATDQAERLRKALAGLDLDI